MSRRDPNGLYLRLEVTPVGFEKLITRGLILVSVQDNPEYESQARERELGQGTAIK